MPQISRETPKVEAADVKHKKLDFPGGNYIKLSGQCGSNGEEKMKQHCGEAAKKYLADDLKDVLMTKDVRRRGRFHNVPTSAGCLVMWMCHNDDDHDKIQLTGSQFNGM